MPNLVRKLIVSVILVSMLAGCDATGEQVATPIPSDAQTASTTVLTTSSPTASPRPSPTAMGGGTGRIAFAGHIDQDSDRIYMMDSDGTNLAPITDEFLILSSLTWSPDGTRLAYCSIDLSGGSTTLSSIDSDGSDETQILEWETTCNNPVWSPDGTQIAFDDYDDVWVVNADGSSPTNLTNSGHRALYPTWSPDGSQIAYSSLENNISQIYVMNADGSSQTNLSLTDEAHDFPAWSPDGSLIAYTVKSDASFASDIYVMNVDGSNKRKLAENETYVNQFTVRWSPDGSKLLFICGIGFSQAICQVDRDGSNFKQLAGDENEYFFSPVWQPAPQLALGPVATIPPIQTGQPTPTSPAIQLPPAGPNGRIAFDMWENGDFEIFVVNPDGSGLTQITDNVDHDFMANWSPDGQRIVFVSERDGNNELYIMDANGSNPTRLTNTPDFPESRPIWSPDGQHILFNPACLDCPADIYVMNADGSGRLNLTNGRGYSQGGSWSPDGKQILFSGDPDHPPLVQSTTTVLTFPSILHFFVIGIDGSNLTKISEDDFESGIYPVWSPDGSAILFVRNARIYITTDNGKTLTPLAAKGLTYDQEPSAAGGDPTATPEPCYFDGGDANPTPTPPPCLPFGVRESTDINPAWSPDGTQIVFESDRDNQTGYYYLWIMNRDGSDLHQITTVEASNPAWSPAP